MAQTIDFLPLFPFFLFFPFFLLPLLPFFPSSLALSIVAPSPSFPLTALAVAISTNTLRTLGLMQKPGFFEKS